VNTVGPMQHTFKVDAYLCKAIQWGYNGNLKMLSELLHDADMKFCQSSH